jgi:hypothetical protein
MAEKSFSAKIKKKISFSQTSLDSISSAAELPSNAAFVDSKSSFLTASKSEVFCQNCRRLTQSVRFRYSGDFSSEKNDIAHSIYD